MPKRWFGMNSPLVLVLITTVFFKGALSLRDTKLSAPVAVKVGEFATLNCHFLLEGDTLYTVKWYFQVDEFYRYTPKRKPPLQIFSTNGNWEDVIDKENSNGTQMTLKRMTPAMSGLYSCEVSADSPSFQTALASAMITVIEPPEGKPAITGLKSKYNWDDVILANCTGPGSKVAANITWSINNRLADTKHVTERKRILDNGLEQSISTIKIHARPHNFVAGRLRLRCTASVSQVYKQTTEKTAEIAEDSLQYTPPSNGNDATPGWRPSYKEYPEHSKQTPLRPTEEGESAEAAAPNSSRIRSLPTYVTAAFHLLLFRVLAFSL